jgi:hypothetical protein
MATAPHTPALAHDSLDNLPSRADRSWSALSDFSPRNRWQQKARRSGPSWSPRNCLFILILLAALTTLLSALTTLLSALTGLLRLLAGIALLPALAALLAAFVLLTALVLVCHEMLLGFSSRRLTTTAHLQCSARAGGSRLLILRHGNLMASVLPTQRSVTSASVLV